MTQDLVPKTYLISICAINKRIIRIFVKDPTKWPTSLCVWHPSPCNQGSFVTSAACCQAFAVTVLWAWDRLTGSWSESQEAVESLFQDNGVVSWEPQFDKLFCIPGTLMTLALIGKGLVLGGWPSKIGDSLVLGTYAYIYLVYKWYIFANWMVMYHLPPITGTENNYWFQDWAQSWNYDYNLGAVTQVFPNLVV